MEQAPLTGSSSASAANIGSGSGTGGCNATLTNALLEDWMVANSHNPHPTYVLNWPSSSSPKALQNSSR
jgi:hypothetical protein